MTDPIKPWAHRKDITEKAAYIVTAARHGIHVTMQFETEERRDEMRQAVNQMLDGETTPGKILLNIGSPRNDRVKPHKPVSANAKPKRERTHCKNGHRYNKKNTYVTMVGTLCCRVCRRESAARSKANRAAKARG